MKASPVTISVDDLERAIAFQTNVLGCTLRARWALGAYLELEGLSFFLRCSAPGQSSETTVMSLGPSAVPFVALYD